MRKILRCIRSIFYALVVVLLVVVLICNLYFIIMNRFAEAEYPRIMGYSAAVVASGSMEPSLSVHDFIINCARDNYEEGDIITFQNHDSLTTHRIIAIDGEEYVTKGDANNTADLDKVPSEAIVGCVVWKIPKLGSVIFFLKTPIGMMLLILMAFLIIGFPFPAQKSYMRDEGE